MTLQNSNIENIVNKRLSVQISLSGFSFLISNLATKERITFFEIFFENPTSPEELLSNIQAAFAERTELNEHFKEVTIVYATNLYNLVPTSLFDETKASEYLKFNSKILATDFIAYDTIDKHDITVVYIPFININNYLFEKFGDFNYFHSTTLLLKQLLINEKDFSLPKVYLSVSERYFDFISIKNGILQICNTYQYNSPEDFIYYTLFCLEQLKMNPDKIEVQLLGKIKEEDNYYKILFNYIRNISFYKLEGTKNNPSETNTSHQHSLLKIL